MTDSLSEQTARCPICHASIAVRERYPRMICAACMACAVDREGRRVRLSNNGLLGHGLVLEAGATRLLDREAEEYPIFVNGVECRAREHRFGGVVVEVIGPRLAS